MERSSRWNRWLYHGFHSLDFPFMYYKRPLWDIVMIVLSIGGIAMSVTSALPAWRRLVRHARTLVPPRQPREVRATIAGRDAPAAGATSYRQENVSDATGQ
jgi:hypothetical protein